MASSYIKEIEDQSSGILDHIEFLRENTSLPNFKGERASLEELLEVVKASEKEFIELATWHIPIYIGRCLIEELTAHRSLESRKSSAMYGKPYIDGFGNIGYENLYLLQLSLSNAKDVKRINNLKRRCYRAMNLRDKFLRGFSNIEGEEVSRLAIEDQCINLEILPTRKSIKFNTEKTRITKYAKLLQIKLTND